MAAPFESLRFHVSRADDETLEAAGMRSPVVRGGARAAADRAPEFNNDEAAARYFLGKLLTRDNRPVLRGLVADEQPGVVPDLRLVSVQPVKQTRTRLLKFEQVRNAVPVFGSNAIVELDQQRELISANVELTDVGPVSPLAAFAAAGAFERIKKLTGAEFDAEKLQAPDLMYYYAEDKKWHLVYYCRSVPAAPAPFLEQARDRKSEGHGVGASPQEMYPRLDYIIDAHNGAILNYYSSDPMVTPSGFQGTDENGAERKFYGVIVAETKEYELYNPGRALKTFDLGGNLLDGDTPIPPTPIRNNNYVWPKHGAAVSAHANAERVHHFYMNVVGRHSIDDKGMELRSVINCTVNSPYDPPPQWHNARWWRDAMWYGQSDESGALKSWARYLDIIAHEMTHGVTKRTAGLVYKNQPGALNESFSDIFGVMINNWGEIGQADPASVDDWNWMMGPGLGKKKGNPLRDMSDPTRTGDPDHMDHYLKTWGDNGGVHTNSNIHNKAAYNVLTSKDDAGNYLFKPRDAANLYYVTLQRLSSTSEFKDALENLVTTVESYYPNPAERDVRVAAVRSAYDRVGIV